MIRINKTDLFLYKKLFRKYDREPLTEHFCCEWSHRCCHIHVVQDSVREEMATCGRKAFFEKISSELDDAFRIIASRMYKHPLANGVFAVSPTLKMKSLQREFSAKGFEVSKTTNASLLRLFPDETVFQAWIKRKEFLERYL